MQGGRVVFYISLFTRVFFFLSFLFFSLLYQRKGAQEIAYCHVWQVNQNFYGSSPPAPKLGAININLYCRLLMRPGIAIHQYVGAFY